MLFSIFAVLTLIIAVATLLPVCRVEKWWFRGFDFPRLQLAFLAFVLLIAEMFLLDWSEFTSLILMLVTFACMLYQIVWIIPYTKLYPVEVKGASADNDRHTIKILTANVLTPNEEYQKLIDIIKEHDPDIIVTLESDKKWEDALSGIEENYQYTIKCPLDNLYGMHLYSKFKLEDSHIEYLIQEDVPSFHTLVVMPNGDKIQCHFLHPAPPSPTENESSSERDAELMVVADKVAEVEKPTIVTGDLNDVAWSRTTRLFRKVSKLLDPRIGRGMFNTFHADHWFLRWPLDHLFHSRHFQFVSIERMPHYGSDHFALLSVLQFNPDTVKGEQSEDMEMTDEEIGREKLEEESCKDVDVPDSETNHDRK